jgi:hypothetical protein
MKRRFKSAGHEYVRLGLLKSKWSVRNICYQPARETERRGWWSVTQVGLGVSDKPFLARPFVSLSFIEVCSFISLKFPDAFTPMKARQGRVFNSSQNIKVSFESHVSYLRSGKGALAESLIGCPQKQDRFSKKLVGRWVVCIYSGWT